MVLSLHKLFTICAKTQTPQPGVKRNEEKKKAAKCSSDSSYLTDGGERNPRKSDPYPPTL